MLMKESHCIYCSSQEFSDEHYLPRCLGRFKGYEELRGRICRGCNEKCGKLDEQLCRSSGAGFFRRYLDIKGRGTHKPINPFYRGSSGGRRIQLKGTSAETGKTVELEYRDGEPMPLTHMAITTQDGASYTLPIPDEMKEPSQLRDAFKKIVGDRTANAEIYCRADDTERIRCLLTGLKFERQDPWTIEQGPATFNNNEINFVVTDRFFRCVAKIGFHHLLQRIPRLTGHEAEFNDIRDFIIREGPLERCQRFFSWHSRQPILALQRGGRLKTWAHVVTAHAEYTRLTAQVQLFVGPEFLAPVYEVNIGPNPSRVHYVQNEGAFFHYYPKEKRLDYDGEVVYLNQAIAVARP